MGEQHTEPTGQSDRPRGRRTPLPELAELAAHLRTAFRASRYTTQDRLVQASKGQLSASAISEMLHGTARRGPEAYRSLAVLLGVEDRINGWLAQVDERRERTAGIAGPVSLEAPVGTLPPYVRGRADLWGELRRRLASPAGRLLVLHGMGGVGKSTLALRLIDHAQERGISAWWVPALDEETTAAHLYELAASLGAKPRELAAARATGTGPRLLWRLLERIEGPWLLVFDGVDNLPGTASGVLADGTGWIRASTRGLVLVTSRDSNPHRWGARANRRPVKPLSRIDAGQVLLDYAPAAGDLAEAEELAERVGGLPLALHLIGSYLRFTYAATTTFSQYKAELDRRTAAFLDQGGPAPQPSQNQAHLRQMIMHTWELSLDALDQRGMPAARILLRLLASFAPTRLPVCTLDPDLLQGRLGGEPTTVASRDVFAPQAPPDEDERDRLLVSLADLGLVDAGRTSQGMRWLQVHSLIAEVSSLHLQAEPDRAHATALLASRLLGDFDEHHAPSQLLNWPLWAMLVPHVRHALKHVPHSPEGLLTRLAVIWSCEQAANYLNRFGDQRAAYRLIEQAIPLTKAPDSGRTFRAMLIRRQAEYAENPHERVRLATQAMREGLLNPKVPIRDSLRAGQIRVSGLLEIGSVAQAAHEVEELIDRSVKVLGEHHPLTLDLRLTRANAWTDRGRVREAAEELAVLADAARQNHASDVEDAVRSTLGPVLARTGNFEDSEAHLRAVLDQSTRQFGPDHPTTWGIRSALADVLRGQLRLDESLHEITECLSLARRRLGPSDRKIVSLRLGLATTLAWAGNLDQAEQELVEIEPFMDRQAVPAALWLNHLAQLHLVRRWRRDGLPTPENFVAQITNQLRDPELEEVLVRAIRETNAAAGATVYERLDDVGE